MEAKKAASDDESFVVGTEVKAIANNSEELCR